MNEDTNYKAWAFLYPRNPQGCSLLLHLEWSNMNLTLKCSFFSNTGFPSHPKAEHSCETFSKAKWYKVKSTCFYERPTLVLVSKEGGPSESGGCLCWQELYSWEPVTSCPYCPQGDLGLLLPNSAHMGRLTSWGTLHGGP